MCLADEEEQRDEGGGSYAWTHADRPALPRSFEGEDEEEGGDGGGDADSGVSSQQEDECLMSPSQRLDKYALSDNILYR